MAARHAPPPPPSPASPSCAALVRQVSLSGCEPKAGGVGIDLTQANVILELRPGTAAARAAEEGADAGLRVGDRVLSVDGVALNGRVLTEVRRALSCADI